MSLATRLALAMFKHQHKIRFADVDYAGIMFYPRYFEMLNAVVEDFFANELGASFAHMIDDLGIGIPLGNVETRFVAPCRLDDILTFTLHVKQLGEKKLILDIVTTCDGEPRATATMALICARQGMANAVPWPENISKNIRRYGESIR